MILAFRLTCSFVILRFSFPIHVLVCVIWTLSLSWLFRMLFWFSSSFFQFLRSVNTKISICLFVYFSDQLVIKSFM